MAGMNEDTQLLITMGKICGQVAHDVRNPLATIQVFLQHLPPDHMPPELRALRDVALSACERINVLAEELLTCRKANQIEIKPLNLNDAIQGVLNEMDVIAQQAEVTLISQFESVEVFYGDGDKLMRVFQNLIGNAIQSAASQENAKVCVHGDIIGNSIVITIRDNGPGIPKECLKVMFTKAFTTKGKCGNGLGLMYCAEVIKAHGGAISARNHSEGGAEFTVTLPLPQAEDQLVRDKK